MGPSSIRAIVFGRQDHFAELLTELIVAESVPVDCVRELPANAASDQQAVLVYVGSELHCENVAHVPGWHQIADGGELILFGDVDAAETGTPPVHSRSGLSVSVLRQWISTTLELARLRRTLEIEQSESALAREFGRLLIRGVSHDLRAPLNSVLGFADLLTMGLETHPAERNKRYVSNISISGRELLQLIDEVVELAKVDESPNYETESVDVVAVVTKIVKLLRQPTHRRGVTLRQSFPPSLTLVVQGDRRRLTRALYLTLFAEVQSAHPGDALRIEPIERDDSGGLRVTLNAPESHSTVTVADDQETALPLWQRTYAEEVIKRHGFSLRRRDRSLDITFPTVVSQHGERPEVHTC